MYLHEGNNSLDNSKDTSGQEAGVCTSDTDALENCRAVVVDGVDTGSVLPEEKHASQEETVKHFALLESSKRLPETSADLPVVALEILVDVVDLLDDVQVIDVEVSHPAEVSHGLFPSALGEEPSRRLLDPESTNHEKTGRNELHSEWNQPLLVTGRHCGVDTIVDPETNQTTNLPSQFVNTDQATTDCRR